MLHLLYVFGTLNEKHDTGIFWRYFNKIHHIVREGEVTHVFLLPVRVLKIENIILISSCKVLHQAVEEELIFDSRPSARNANLTCGLRVTFYLCFTNGVSKEIVVIMTTPKFTFQYLPLLMRHIL